MWLLFLCLAAVCAQETEDKEAVVSTTIKPQVRIEEMLPITKPSISEFAMKEVPPNTTEPNPKKSDFRASPQLETYIEYNRFPVKPVWPQPKQIKTFQQIQNEIRPNPTIPTKYLSVSSTLAPTKHNAEEKQSYYQNKPIRSDSDLDPLKFYDKYNFPGHQIPFYPTESPISGLDWANSAVYTKPIVEQPYAFVNHEEHKKEEYIAPGSLSIEEEYDLSRPKKTPWKKIVKFLATVIPIGLLLSALTPNILHIGPPINTTQ